MGGNLLWQEVRVCHDVERGLARCRSRRLPRVRLFGLVSVEVGTIVFQADGKH
jgi:hypothetical protein